MSATGLLERPERSVVRERTYARFDEVPLNYSGNETTLVLSNGATPLRVIIHTATTGGELRAFCLSKGWKVAESALVLTKRDQAKQMRFESKREANAAIVDPMVEQAEWTRKADEKG